MPISEPSGKDLSVLKIDRENKEPLKPRKKGRWLAVLGSVAALMVLLAGVLLVTGGFASAPLVTVDTPSIEHGTAAGSVVLTAGGYIVAHHTIEVSSKVTGKVAWVGVEKGDHVQEGQVLVRLEDDEFRAQLDQAQAGLQVAKAHLLELENGSRPQEIDAAKAAVEQAQADFENNSLIYKRTGELAAQGIDSKEVLDNAKAQYDMAKAKLDSAKKNYDLVKLGPRIEEIEYARAQVAQAKAQVDYAQTMLDSTLIRAPVTGTVLDRLVEKGEMVTTMTLSSSGGAKASVVTLADLNDLQVELDINQNDFPKISPNQNCTLSADAYPDRIYKGVVAEIAPEADRQKATIQVKVKILHPDSYLRPEMNAHVSFLAPAASSANPQSSDLLTVPHSALAQKNGKPAVFVLDGSRVKLRGIQVGHDLGDRVEVVDGLGPNDQVVIAGVSGLVSGQKVKVKAGS